MMIQDGMLYRVLGGFIGFDRVRGARVCRG